MEQHYAALQKHPEHVEGFKRAFDLYDADHSGQIDAPEFLKAFRLLHENVSEEDIAALLRRFDRDGDGSVNEEEFMRMMAFCDLADEEVEEDDN